MESRLYSHSSLESGLCLLFSDRNPGGPGTPLPVAVADQYIEPQNNMASKWGMQTGLPVSISTAVRDDKKTTRPSSIQQLNEISLAMQGQQTVQDIVTRATNLFRHMEEAKMVVDERSKVEARNNNKIIQETLSGLKELFSRLRAIYDESNRRVDIPHGENLEVSFWCLILLRFKVPYFLD